MYHLKTYVSALTLFKLIGQTSITQGLFILYSESSFGICLLMSLEKIKIKSPGEPRERQLGEVQCVMSKANKA